LRIAEVPGADGAAAELGPLADRGRTLNAADLIDRDAVFRLKQEALDILWKRAGDNRELDRFVTECGTGLDEFAVFCVLAETHGPNWRVWPEELRHPASPAVARFAEARRERVAYHKWVQWLIDAQLREAARSIPLLQDLPIGFDPGGADAWAWQDLLAGDAVVGAPPDAFNNLGQDWGLPPFIPHKLRASGYAPLRETLRFVLRHAGGLRVDHVMGLFRLYWIPKGFPPSRGAYVRYPHKEILDVVAEESRRAKAYVVGEDLGTVETGARETMAKRGLLGSKVFWFESDPPYAWPSSTMASLSTHDLPTLAGLWSGADAAEQRALGLSANADSMQPMVQRLRGLAGVAQKADSREVVRRAHRLISEASSALIAGALEDALAVERRPNLPGTVLERPNWRIPLPYSLEEIETHPLVLEVAACLDRRP
jgi:4-alpha-glucanotransferase